MNEKEFTPGPVPITLKAFIATDGRAYIFGATYSIQEGMKVIGNGTLTHPLGVELSGPYAAAPELLAACKAFMGAYMCDAFDCNEHGEKVRVIIQDAIIKAERSNS